MIRPPASKEEVANFLRDRVEPLHITYGIGEHPQYQTLSLSQLNTVLLYEPEEMIISVGAGISLQALERALAEHGQWIPTLAADEVPQDRLGDAIANDYYHPRSLTCGMLRTSILGGTFCTTNGEIFQSGSRVVKSVAGYDIHRAFCGSRGMFGAMISLTMKVQPRPGMFFRFQTSSEHKDTLHRFTPTVFEILGDEIVVELAGHSEDIESDIEQLRVEKITSRELNNTDWLDALQLIRSNKKNAPIASEAEHLLSKVRTVFDPKNILR
ncbi:MAG TPA: FAD-binding oxidoreductase [Candidatus Kapabacteria bacterium]|nr:FAD-binding oxidoreductase [Candidatus Kapabacteria bacterium]